MIDTVFFGLEFLENFLWVYFGVPIILFLGVYFSFKSKFFQIRRLPVIFCMFKNLLKHQEKNCGTIHPLKAFFAAVGGCVGIGNIVGIGTAVQFGGPGALFWVWVTAIAGMIIKYSEVYLGVKFREPNGEGGFNGGPMYFLKKVFKTSWAPAIVCVLLCIYGVEVFQFSVIIHSVSSNLDINKYGLIITLLTLVIFAGLGGVRRVANIATMIVPLFIVIYMGMGLWVLVQNFMKLPEVLHNVFVYAFNEHAAFGGFLGSTLMYTISHGIRRGCYTGDVGVGYASVIHSETSLNQPEKQAALGILDIFLDTFMVCTTSILVILATDVWHLPIDSSMLVQTALSNYFPYMQYFMPFFFFLLGYSTINAYFCVGLKCARHLSPRLGAPVYIIYSIISLTLFSFGGTAQAQTVMAIAGVLLLVINAYGIFKLRNEISFDFELEPIQVEAQKKAVIQQG